MVTRVQEVVTPPHEITKRIERFIEGEYGRPTPPHFPRTVIELLCQVSKAIRESLAQEHPAFDGC